MRVPQLHFRHRLLLLFPFLLLCCSTLPLATSTGRALLLADVHVDSLYDASLSPACKCQARYDTDGTCSEGSHRNPFGQFGCDPSPALAESALAAAAAALPSPDFIIFGGDYMAHSSPSAAATLAAVSAVTELLGEHWSGGTLITPNLGNSDVFGDYHLNVTDGTLENEWLAKVSALWGGVTSSSVLGSTVSTGGYFAAEAAPGLTIISLNTVIYSPKHTPYVSSEDDPDPFGQLAWLAATLAALDKQDGAAAVWVVGHIPPAMDAFSYVENWEFYFADKYLGVITGYEHLVRAQFFGHVHSDEWRCVTARNAWWDSSSYGWWGDDDDNSADDATPSSSTASSSTAKQQQQRPGPLFITGAVSPVYNANPSFRIVEYDDDATSASFGAVTDWHVYSTLLSEGDAVPGRLSSDLSWFPLYTASEAYGLTSFSNTALVGLGAAMLVDDALFAAFVTHIHADCTASLELEGESGFLAEALDKCYTPAECAADYAGCRKKHTCALLHGARPDAFAACAACDAGAAAAFAASSSSSSSSSAQVLASLEAAAIRDPSGCDPSAFSETSSSSSSSSSSSIRSACSGSPLCGLQRYADNHMHGKNLVLLLAAMLVVAAFVAYRRGAFRVAYGHRRGLWSEKASFSYDGLAEGFEEGPQHHAQHGASYTTEDDDQEQRGTFADDASSVLPSLNPFTTATHYAGDNNHESASLLSC